MTKNRKKNPALLKDEVSTLHDEIKQLHSKLAMSNSAFLTVVGKSFDGVIILDQKKMVVYANYAAIRLFDRNIADLLGEPLDLNIDPLTLVLSNEATTELRIPKANGSEAVTEVSVLETEWNNETCYVVSFRDITERKKAEEMLAYLSTHDYLTDLPNRVYFEKQINNAIQYADEYGQYMALLYLDLDNFKMVNDTFGHSMGDLLLKEVSTLLQQSVRGQDTVTRLGGDEFALILNGLRKPAYAASVANNLLDKLSKVLYLEDKEIYMNASIGIAVYPGSGTNVDELIKNADAAMYVSKSHGKNQYRYFSKELSEQNEQHRQIINGLRQAIPNQELFLVYQPIHDLHQSTCCGFEALVRWMHPHLGLIPPSLFLPCAEETGMMINIGHWVIHHALEDYNKLHLESLLFISIHMSGNELAAKKTTETLLSSVQEQGISAEKLVLELTEATIMSHPEASIQKFKALSEIGIMIAIDDFGTGYSSLKLLKQLPISILKIDKSFIEDIGVDNNSTLIVKSTIQLAHGLGIKVVAEGVETKEQLAFLKEHHCDFAQGFYFSEPLDITHLKKYIQALNR